MASFDGRNKIIMNSNHNSSQPYAPPDHEQVLEETREVLNRFLERRLSQDEPSDSIYSKSDGYRRLKREGKQPLYHRQHSKPERGSLEKRTWGGRRKSAGPSTSTQVTGVWHGQNSHPSLKSETGQSLKPQLVAEEPKYQSEMDVRAIHRLTEMANSEAHADSNSIMFRLLRSQNNLPTTNPPRNSLPSAGEDEQNHTRRTSFTRALSRKPVLSYIENQGKLSSKVGVDKIDGPSHSRQPSSDQQVFPEEATSHQRQDSGLKDGAVITPQPPVIDAMPKDEDKHKNKALSFRQRMRNIMSNKKKLKYKKPDGPISAPKTDDTAPWDDKSRPNDESKVRSAGARMNYSIDAEFNRAAIEGKTHSASGSMTFPVGNDSNKFLSAKHKSSGSTSNERTPSLTKTKNLVDSPKIHHRGFSLKRFSPKFKRRPFHQSGSSASLSVMAGSNNSGELKRDKSGSLPLSMRYGVGPQLNAKNQRRLSESLFPVNVGEKHRKKSLSLDKPEPVHPQHHNHDYHHFHETKDKKQKPIGKLRRFIRMFRKRHASESSTASSKGSHSLPSIPAAIEMEQNGKIEYDNVTGSPDMRILRRMIDRDEGADDRLPAADDDSLYHHRGSLSFSSGDLDGLSAPEKKQIFDEIAETLSRLSSKYTRHIRSRSATQITRMETSEEMKENLPNGEKSTVSSPPSRQASTTASKGQVHSPGKGFRKYEKNKSPAMNAYLNLSNNQTRTKEARPNRKDAVMPRSFSPRFRRYIELCKTETIDSSQSVQAPIPDIQIQSPQESPESQDNDVVDGCVVMEEEETFRFIQSDTFLPESLGDVSTLVVEQDYSSVTLFQGSDVDLPFVDETNTSAEKQRSRASRPSTSKADDAMFDDGGDDMGDNPYVAQIDEDKLVQALVDLLCKKGDEYQRSVDMPNGVGVPLTPVFRTSVLRYISRVTSYSVFQSFAQRFCSRCRQIVETAPTSHPEVFPFVMVFSMAQFIVSLARSEQVTDRIDQIKEYTSIFISKLVEGSSNWDTVLEQLQDTEAELSQEEEDSSLNPLRKDPSTDDELD